MNTSTRARTLAVTGALTLAALVPLAGNPATADVAERGKSFSVTASAAKTDVKLGQQVVIRGEVSPKAVGKKVWLQKRLSEDKPWKAENSAKIKADGTFVITDKPTTVAARWYRVAKPADGNRAAGFSNPIKVTMWRWNKLGLLVARNYDKFYVGSVKMNLDTYPASFFNFSSDTAGYRDYNLGKQCRRFRATMGVGDASDDGATATLRVADGDTVLWQKDYKLAEPQTLGLDITDVFRLKVSFTTPKAGSVAVVGTPQVLCTF